MSNINTTINQIMQFCITETKSIIVELQNKRFENNGQFNDHIPWAKNAEDVIEDKGRNQPLVDIGNLKKSLTTESNWDLKTQITQNTLKLTIPQEENFTDIKYDKLETGGKSDPYVSPRGNKMKARNLPPRPFKDISDQDADWIAEKLAQAIEDNFT